MLIILKDGLLTIVKKPTLLKLSCYVHASHLTMFYQKYYKELCNTDKTERLNDMFSPMISIYLNRKTVNE